MMENLIPAIGCWIPPLLSALAAVAPIPGGPSDAISLDSAHSAEEVRFVQEIGSDEIIRNWDSYRDDKSTDIEGQLECLTGQFCNFVPASEDARILWVGTKGLSVHEARNLARVCSTYCYVKVRGHLDLPFVTAEKILYLGKK